MKRLTQIALKKMEDESDELTIAYMMGAESANDTIRALKKRIEELEEEVLELSKEIERWKEGEYRP